MGDHYPLILETVGICFSIAFFNGFGVATTKYASAPQRSTVDTSRTLIIWFFFLLYPYAPETFHWIQLVGFFFLILGTLVYNEIIIIPWFGFNENTKKAIVERREEEERSLLHGGAKKSMAQKEVAKNKNPDYAAFSPQATYDANRNVRHLQQKMDAVAETGKNEEMEMNLNNTEHENDDK